MEKHYLRNSLIVGVAVFLISMFVLAALGAPAPYLGSLVIAFFAFEISFYHLFAKNRGERNFFYKKRNNL
ncbi:hypothetical protein [Halobacillus halophilus]|uniref:hypothetical protein n=1 Tax=Halobacillus halophilus TaxID=1570 RepID=UPI001CD5AE6C|nr:hypothetical protein [Halobacillus halophilus]MCA1011363.1 hypothetical protein [Halobacillus halophilus]